MPPSIFLDSRFLEPIFVSLGGFINRDSTVITWVRFSHHKEITLQGFPQFFTPGGILKGLFLVLQIIVLKAIETGSKNKA